MTIKSRWKVRFPRLHHKRGKRKAYRICRYLRNQSLALGNCDLIHIHMGRKTVTIASTAFRDYRVLVGEVLFVTDDTIVMKDRVLKRVKRAD